MYFLFSRHNITPGQFYRLSHGERTLLNVFCEREIEQMSDR